MAGLRRVTTLLVLSMAFNRGVVDGYLECSNAGHELGECMPESQCRAMGGIKGLNSEQRCNNDEESNLINLEKQVYCTTNFHLAKDLCSTWLPHWAANDDTCSLEIHARSGVERVAGGESTKKGEFKHMIAVGSFDKSSLDNKWFCGGALISPHFVLTAAHCVDEEDTLYKVKVGEHDMETELRSKKNVIKMKLPEYLHRSTEYNQVLNNTVYLERIINVKRIIKHPNYIKTRDDIALLELEEQVLLNDFVLPACIPFDDDHQPTPGQLLTVSGWGIKKHAGTRAIKLKKVEIPVVDTDSCQALFKKKGYTLHKLNPDHLCAGKDGADACKGDSGGALGAQVPREDGTSCGFNAIGIVSWGGECGLMGVYTRVSSYINWIMQYLAPQHYNQYIFENIYNQGLDFDGFSMLQFNINEDIFTHGFRIQLYFKTEKNDFILVAIPTAQGSNITLEMKKTKLVYTDLLGGISLESVRSYVDNKWHYLTVECRISTEHCYLQISEESLEAPWTLPSSSSSGEGLVTDLFVGGLTGCNENYEEDLPKCFKGSLVYSSASPLKLESVKNSAGQVMAYGGSSPAGGAVSDADLSNLQLGQQAMLNEMILMKRLLQSISAKINRFMPDESETSLYDPSSNKCMPAFNLLRGTNECFFFGKMPLTLSEAKSSCDIMGAKLAVPGNLDELEAYMLARNLRAYHWVDGDKSSARSNGQAVNDNCWEISNEIHTGETCLMYHPGKGGYCGRNTCGEDVKARYICQSEKLPFDGKR